MKKRNFRIFIILLIFIVITGMFFYFFGYNRFKQNTGINVGVLFSATGTMADSTRPVTRAALLAIDQINKQGGINGKLIIPIVYDGASDSKKYAALARKMILEDHVKVIFGCWTSACRKAVKPIVEKYNGLLIYPTHYEGIEQSNNIIYLGTAPNQELTPAASWMFTHYTGKKVFLVGSDYIYPHVSNEILAHQTRLFGGKIVGVQYIPIGSMDVDKVIHKIIRANPDFVFNTINGSTNVAFFKRLSQLTEGHKRPPVMSFSLSPTEMHLIGENKMLGDYAAWSYFPTWQNPENTAFLKTYHKKYGSIQDVSDPAVTIYSGVYLWARAVKKSPSTEPNIVRDFMLRSSIASPAGVIYIDPSNANTWRTVMIGKINPTGIYDIVWSSSAPIQPVVYPDFKTKAAWNVFEYQLYTQWGKVWREPLGDQKNNAQR